MITKNELKYYSSFNQKKFRKAEKKFIAEGKKIVKEGLKARFACEIILATTDFVSGNEPLIKLARDKMIRVETISNKEFEKISDTKSPQGIAAVFDIVKSGQDISIIENENFIVYLDDISDPGNVGTILRTCDWFGLNSIIISPNSADHYSPKVLRSSMGSIFHLNIYIGNINLLKNRFDSFKIVCSDLDGKDIFTYKFPEKTILVLSNESTGPSEAILQICFDRITVPGKGKAESLNVASAAAIILSQISR